MVSIAKTNGNSSKSQFNDEYFEVEVFQRESFNQSSGITLRTKLLPKANDIDNVYGVIFDLSLSNWILGNTVMNFDNKTARIVEGFGN